MDIAIHVNPHIAHQGRTGEAFRKGIERHGLKVKITYSPFEPADIHIINGPWFAHKMWCEHPRTIMIDAPYYHSTASHVSLGWVHKFGRTFISGIGRTPVQRAKEKTGNRTIFLADYQGPLERADTIRLHPSEQENQPPLQEQLQAHDMAIGHNTTALVVAWLLGLKTIARNPYHILNQGVHLLPYADWSLDEIQNGEAWRHLTQNLTL